MAVLAGTGLAIPDSPPPAQVSTFSIVAYEPAHKEWGVAVASKYLAEGRPVQATVAGPDLIEAARKESPELFDVVAPV